MMLLNPVDELLAWPGCPTCKLATSLPRFPLSESLLTMATLDEPWSPIATRVPFLLAAKVRGMVPYEEVIWLKVTVPLEERAKVAIESFGGNP
mgnify:CR=1 FL=1|jgi:hypothetical protein